MNDEQFETLLRKAPRRSAPDGLLEKLQADIQLPRQVTPACGDWRVWLRRWIPALGFAMIFLSCVIVLAIQTYTLAELRERNNALKAEWVNREQALSSQMGQPAQARQAQALEWLRQDHEELQRLREEITQLRAQLPEVERLRMENQQMAAIRAAAPPPQETDHEFFTRVADQAASVKCANNLKNIGLAARVWTTEQGGDKRPETFLQMADALSTSMILHCPADTNRTMVRDFNEFTSANLSYELLSPGVSERETKVVYARCPIHNHVCMVDGTVIMNREIEQRNGKWILKQPAPADFE